MQQKEYALDLPDIFKKSVFHLLPVLISLDLECNSGTQISRLTPHNVA